MFVVCTTLDVLRTATAADRQHIAVAAFFIVKRIAHKCHVCNSGERHCSITYIADTETWISKMLKTMVDVALGVNGWLVSAAVHARQTMTR